MQLPGDTGRITMKYITETFDQAARRVPELATLSDKAISKTLAQGMELVDTIPGYSLMQYVAAVGTQPSLFVFRSTTLPEASPATKGQCNDERACGACFSGQVQCEHASDCAQHNEPAMPAGPCDCGAAPAPQVTPADVEASIASEHYFTAQEGVFGAHPGFGPQPVDSLPLGMTTICTLVTKNGHSVVGAAYFADPAKFSTKAGCDAARADAIRQLWPMVIYSERERLAAAPNIALSYAEAQSNYDRVRWAEDLIRQLPADHEGRNSWLLNFGTAAPDLRPTASGDDF